MTNTGLTSIKGLGPKRVEALKLAGIQTAQDFLYYLPREYRDLTRITPLCELRVGEPCAMRVCVAAPAATVRAGGVILTRAPVSDGTEALPAVWFNQPWLREQLKVGRELLLYGHSEVKNGRMQISCPSIETEQGLVPVYKPIPGMPAKMLRSVIAEILDKTACDEDPLPEAIRERFGLLTLNDALRGAHFPSSAERLRAALHRLSFENLLLFQLAVGVMREHVRAGTAIPSGADDEAAYWRAKARAARNRRRYGRNERHGATGAGRRGLRKDRRRVRRDLSRRARGLAERHDGADGDSGRAAL